MRVCSRGQGEDLGLVGDSRGVGSNNGHLGIERVCVRVRKSLVCLAQNARSASGGLLWFLKVIETVEMMLLMERRCLLRLRDRCGLADGLVEVLGSGLVAEQRPIECLDVGRGIHGYREYIRQPVWIELLIRLS